MPQVEESTRAIDIWPISELSRWVAFSSFEKAKSQNPEEAVWITSSWAYMLYGGIQGRERVKSGRAVESETSQQEKQKKKE